MNKKESILVGVAVVVVIIVGLLLLKSYGPSSISSKLNFLPFGQSSDEKVAKKALDFINQNLLQEGQKAELVSSSTDSGVIKFTIKIGTDNYDSFITKNGKLFCPQIYDLSQPSPAASPAASPAN